MESIGKIQQNLTHILQLIELVFIFDTLLSYDLAHFLSRMKVEWKEKMVMLYNLSKYLSGRSILNRGLKQNSKTSAGNDYKQNKFTSVS